MEYLDNIRKNRKVKEIEIIKVKIIKLIIKIMKNFLEFEIDVGELKDREIKIRNERKQLFTKPVNISVDTDKSGEKQMMKWRAFAGNIWHN